MIDFKCICGWRFIISKKHIFGPIWDDDKNPIDSARIQSRSAFKEGYADCHYNYKRRKR